MWMYNQCRVSASLLAVENLRTQPEIINSYTSHKNKSFKVMDHFLTEFSLTMKCFQGQLFELEQIPSPPE